MRISVLCAAACLIMAACQSKQGGVETLKADAEAFALLIENVYETVPENSESIIRDNRVRVTSPEMDGIWFYTQLNTGKEGKLYRQRVSQLTLSDDENSVVQIAYGLKDPEKYADAWMMPGLLSALTRDDFDPYFTKGCEKIWTPQVGDVWTGYVDPKTCIITSKRRDKDIRIESEGYISKDIYRTNERGYDMDMTFLWGTKPGEFIELYPQN